MKMIKIEETLKKFNEILKANKFKEKVEITDLHLFDYKIEAEKFLDYVCENEEIKWNDIIFLNNKVEEKYLIAYYDTNKKQFIK